MSIQAGELKERIGLRRVFTSRGALGEVLPDKILEIATVWAKVEAISNRKIRTFEQSQVVETYQFTLRPRKDIQQGWQIVWQARVFTVRAVERIQADRLVITAEANLYHDRTDP